MRSPFEAAGSVIADGDAPVKVFAFEVQHERNESKGIEKKAAGAAATGEYGTRRYFFFPFGFFVSSSPPSRRRRPSKVLGARSPALE